MSFTRQERTAYHEAGHAVASHLCKYAPNIRKVTIVPTEEAHGHVSPYAESSFQPEFNTDLRRIVDRVTVLLAGNEAVKKLTGRYDNRGASEDRSEAVNLALYETGSSEETAALINWVQVRTKNLVDFHWDYIRAVATELLQRKTLSGRATSKVIYDEMTRLIAEQKKSNEERNQP